jgi:hypothetical protein
MPRRVLPLILILMMVGVFARPALAAFDPSEYRANTYGPPTHYCDPTRPLSSAGAGTLANPWNLDQAMRLAVAGNVVGILPGVSVRLPSTNNDNIATFRPYNSGTASARIVYVSRFAAVALADVANNPNRTQLRHDGVRAVATGASETGSGSAIMGSYNTNYVTFDGFFIDMVEAQPKSDGGVIRAENSRGTHFRNFEIKGTRTNMGTNPVLYRPNNAQDTVLSNFRVYDFSNDTSNSNTPQRGLFSDQYGDQNFLIEHFEIRNTERGIFLKGTYNGTFNYGTIRYGIVSNVVECFRFNDLDPVNVTRLEYSLCHDVIPGGIGTGVSLSAETSSPRNILVHHVTVARMQSADLINGGLYARRGMDVNVQFRDNLIELDNGPYGHGVAMAEISTMPAMLDYNGYYKNGSTVTFAFNNVEYNNINTWRSVTGRDQNSQVLTSSPFVDRVNRNFRIAAGHPAMTMSSSGGQLGAYGGPEVPGVDLGNGPTYTLPAAPTNVRILR